MLGVRVIGEASGCIETFECKVCDGINPPPPDFCQADEELVPIYEDGCLAGFECHAVPPPD
jgi:hypothetical protein